MMWLGVGGMLLYKGIRLISAGTLDPTSLSHFWASPQQGAAVLMALSFMVGYLKGFFILPKTVKRVVNRIRSLPEPIHWAKAYPRSYWALLGGMVILGGLVRFLPIPIDLRGAIDLAVGSALIRGSLLYFRVVLRPVPQSPLKY